MNSASPSLSTSALRKHIRTRLRKNRRALSARQQRHASLHLYRQMMRLPAFHGARHLAFYLPIDGEIDPSPLLQHALRERKACYLPVIHPRNQRMVFVRFNPLKKLLRNKWGILQPRLQSRHGIAPWALDLVFVPLAGFDSTCARLGMGKGYYDRTFQFRRKSGRRRPLLIGLAHECQRHDFLPSESWDVPMDAVISDKAVYGNPGGKTTGSRFVR